MCVCVCVCLKGDDNKAPSNSAGYQGHLKATSPSSGVFPLWINTLTQKRRAMVTVTADSLGYLSLA